MTTINNFNHQEDLEKQQLNSDDQDTYIDYLHFEKIYEANKEKIHYYETAMKYSQVITILIGFISLVFFSVVLLNNKLFQFSWLMPTLTFLIGVITLALTINFFLNLTVIYHEGTSLASWVSYFSVNLAAINFIIFLICFFLKIENLINVQWKIITIPLYIVIGICLFYFIFMMPAFINNESYWDITLISSLILNTLAFLILLNSRLDNSFKFSYVAIFTPVWITNTIFFIYLGYQFFTNKDLNEVLNIIINFIVNTSITIAAVLIAMNLDSIIKTPNLVPLLLIIFSYVLFFTERLLAQFNVFIFEKTA